MRRLEKSFQTHTSIANAVMNPIFRSDNQPHSNNLLSHSSAQRNKFPEKKIKQMEVLKQILNRKKLETKVWTTNNTSVKECAL